VSLDPTAAPLVAPRKAIALLRETPDRLETLLRWCSEKDAVRPLEGEPATIRGIVARMGTLDRECFLEAARRIASGEPLPSLPGFSADPVTEQIEREFGEWITRFRHVRAQSVAFLEVVEPDAFDRSGADPVLGEMTLARIVTTWVASDADAMARLTAASVTGRHAAAADP
jgi:hypothetical protein